MMPTTKIRQETMVFTYLKAYLISVGFKHMGGEAPRGQAGIWAGGGAEVSFPWGSGTVWESRTKREAAASPASSRHSRATARILHRTSSLARTFQKTHARLQAGTLAGVAPTGLGLERTLKEKKENHHFKERTVSQFHIWLLTAAVGTRLPQIRSSWNFFPLDPVT